jgi:hypothetical protein
VKAGVRSDTHSSKVKARFQRVFFASLMEHHYFLGISLIIMTHKPLS